MPCRHPLRPLLVAGALLAAGAGAGSAGAQAPPAPQPTVAGYDLERLESALRAAVPEFNPAVDADGARESSTIVAFPARRARQQ